MKEYIAKTGGRYTYVDDLINLQELAISVTSLFDDCANFIISGCVVEDHKITPGFVWLNGKVRYYEGYAEATDFPLYITERNEYETIAYAGDVNKQGRCCYLTSTSQIIPDTIDPVTGKRPEYISIKEEYAPRLIDRFFGKYALLLDTPFTVQTVKKDLVLAGNLTGEKQIESKAAISVANPNNGYSLKSIVKTSGDGSLGVYSNGILVNEIIISTDGTFTLNKQGTELFSVDSTGTRVSTIFSKISESGSLRFQDSDIYNFKDATDEGAVNINRVGYNGQGGYHRDFNVFNGRSSTPIFSVRGYENLVRINGDFEVLSSGGCIKLKNTSYKKTDKPLLSYLQWIDNANERLGVVGYIDPENCNLSVNNEVGNILLTTKGWVDIEGELRIAGINIADTYLAIADAQTELSKKVDKIAGKGLSAEDFTSEFKAKLESITSSSLISGGNGFISASEVSAALKLKLTVSSNLADLANVSTARTNLDVYSKTEGNSRYLQTSNFLSEIITLSAEDIENKTPEQIIELKEQRQKTARESINAEMMGTGDLKLAKASNLSDLSDKSKARTNLNVYSIEQIDQKLAGKLDSADGYSGIPFTQELKAKLDGIKTGIFSGADSSGANQTQVEGYVTTSSVVFQLTKYAPKLLTGYSTADKATIAANINVYTKTETDARYGKLSSSFQDYITYLTGIGQTTTNAQKTLRDKIGAAASSDLSSYLTKSGKLSDLTVSSDSDRKAICTKIGAAYAADYQTKLSDTGWVPCTGSNAGTLFARQIGNIVCIQGTINTGKRTGGNWGGVVAIIPNSISPPRYACRTTLCTWNDGHKYNRGSSFVISSYSRNIVLYESGWNNQQTEIHFSYMT